MGHSQSSMNGKFKRIGGVDLRISDFCMPFPESLRRIMVKRPQPESCVFRPAPVAIRKSIAHEEAAEGIP
jgi:hypothetical protein